MTEMHKNDFDSDSGSFSDDSHLNLTPTSSSSDAEYATNFPDEQFGTVAEMRVQIQRLKGVLEAKKKEEIQQRLQQIQQLEADEQARAERDTEHERLIEHGEALRTSFEKQVKELERERDEARQAQQDQQLQQLQQLQTDKDAHAEDDKQRDAELKRLHDDHGLLRASHEHLLQQLADQAQQLQQLQADKDAHTEHDQQREAEIKRIKAQIEPENASHDKRIKQLQCERDEARQATRAQQDQQFHLLRQIQQLQADNQAHAEHDRQREANIERIKKEVRERVKQTIRDRDATVGSLINEGEALPTESNGLIQQLEEKNARLTAQCELFKADIERRVKEKDKLVEENKTLIEENEQLIKEKDFLTEESKVVEKQRKNLQITAICREEELEYLTSRVSRIQKRLEEAEQRALELRPHVVDFAEINAFRPQVTRLPKKEQAEIYRLEAELYKRYALYLNQRAGYEDGEEEFRKYANEQLPKLLRTVKSLTARFES